MFCNGFIEPIFTGILLNSVSSEEAATASSVLIFMQMVLGFLPAPYVYGLLVDEFPTVDEEGDNTSPWGMRGVSFYSVLGVLALLVSILVRKRSPQSEMARSVVSIQAPNEEQLLAQDQSLDAQALMDVAFAAEKKTPPQPSEVSAADEETQSFEV